MLLFRMDLEHISILRPTPGQQPGGSRGLSLIRARHRIALAISKECKYYDEINAAVKVLIDNGTTDELYAKWCE